LKALCYHGKHDIRHDTVPDPRIEHARDAIVKVTSCAICGSDLHLYDGLVPGMKRGDVMGHEFMGEVVEAGPENRRLKVGERVVVPFTILCGECEQCRRGNFSVCERSNRNKAMADRMFGHSTAGPYADGPGMYRALARDSLKWLARPGSEVLPTSRVRALAHPAAPAG